MVTRQIAFGALGAILLGTAWWFSDFLGAPRRLLPPLPEVIDAFVSVAQSGELLSDIYATTSRWLAGFSIGAVIGISLGFVIGSQTWLKHMTSPILDFFRSLPITASFPLFLLIFGIGDQSKIAMAAFATLMPVLVASVQSITEIPSDRLRAIKVYGASRAYVALRIVPFQAVPVIYNALRTSLSFALMVTIVAEMFIGSGNGIGQRAFEAFQLNNTATIYVYLVIAGILGIIVNAIINTINTAFRGRYGIS